VVSSLQISYRNFVCSSHRSLKLNYQNPRVVTGEKNSPTVAHACRKRRLKWVLPQVGGWEHRASNPVSVKNLTAIETSLQLLRPCVPVGTKRTNE
jgi:hypothetical protein